MFLILTALEYISFNFPLVKLLECKINNMYAQCDCNAPCDLPKILLAIANTTLAMFLVSLETLQRIRVLLAMLLVPLETPQ
jgi:hypothetical protein